MSKRSKACDISPAVREAVYKRDKHSCIVCGRTQNIQVAHFISRGRGGLGIEENLGCMCLQHHYDFDNGKYHIEIGQIFEEYLKEHYPEWDKEKLIYKKWSF